ncbi:hypothetical protein DFH09DRAFT_1372122, partial [Mycena vulgaris]
MSPSRSSPASPIQFIAFSPSPSPATRKRQRLNATPIPVTPTRHRVLAPALPHSPYRFDSNDQVVDNPAPIPPAASLLTGVPPAADPGHVLPANTMQSSLDQLEEKSHAIRQAIAAQEQSDKETG